MQDLIFVSLENWDDIWRRNQFVCAELARRNPAAKILFVGLPIDVSNAVRCRQWDQIRSASTFPVEGFPNLVVTRPLKLLPESLALGRQINAAMARRHVQRAAKLVGITRPFLWLNPHSAVHMAGKMSEIGIIYDVTDDWASLSQPDAMRQRIVRHDAELCKKADAVIVCSQRLLEMKEALSERVHLISNGVEVEHYEYVAAGEGPLPAEAKSWTKPVFGYTGTIHPDRVDAELVAAVSERLQQRGSLVFVGPNHLSAKTIKTLTKRGNVFFVPPVPYQRIPDYMRAFDVCMVPHRMSAFTESLNPIKLWEYLAAGKPIVATDVAGFRDYPNLVRVARSADEFVSELWAAFAEGKLNTPARQRESRKHSWEHRVDEIERVLAEVGATPELAEVGS